MPDPHYTADQIVNPGRIGNTKGASDLKPEKITSYELQYIYDLSRFRLEASIYQNQAENIVKQVPTPLSDPNFDLTFENAGEKVTEGFDLGITSQISDWIKVFGLYSYVTGSVDENDDVVPSAPKHQCKVGIHFLLMENKLNLYLHDLYVGEIYNFPGSNFDLPGYNLVDLHLTTTEAFSRNWVFSVGINNVFDEKDYAGPVIEENDFYFPPPIMRRLWTTKISYKF